MILILSQYAQDITVVRLSRVLQTLGHEPLILDAAAVARLQVSLELNGAEASCRLRVDGRDVALSQLRSAWLWRGWLRTADEAGLGELTSRPADWNFFRAEWSAFYKALSMALAHSGVFCVNPSPQGGAAEEKCGQLLVAAQCGLRVPSTLYTARLPPARQFLQEQGGAIVYKPFTTYARLENAQDPSKARAVRLYTNRVREEDLVEAEGFIPSPGIFQPYVDKALELRIVVIGQRLFACAIHSQEQERGRNDWRRGDTQTTRYEPYALPDVVAGRLRLLMQRLGLVFGSIDMIVTPEGEYVFLEVNPSGQFDWIAHFSHMPIYEHLAAMLVAGRVDYPVPDSHAA